MPKQPKQPRYSVSRKGAGPKPKPKASVSPACCGLGCTKKVVASKSITCGADPCDAFVREGHVELYRILLKTRSKLLDNPEVLKCYEDQRKLFEESIVQQRQVEALKSAEEDTAKFALMVKTMSKEVKKGTKSYRVAMASDNDKEADDSESDDALDGDDDAELADAFDKHFGAPETPTES
ncbi:hypothetical protein TSOC_004220 [Tetrabaena socialis]|uniref:Uncharacterized protein n=1 Tax=Tetrabaena socialis TaxID=47790 RepID=A0A2J8A9F1_9CHLO|nr:hypothetical protein TSOC_004220 [Tetrabaena socialis]|eukprot:PNH09157.1 hypothetical protein TSOC_004220 [Tetrabaena socialis]